MLRNGLRRPQSRFNFFAFLNFLRKLPRPLLDALLHFLVAASQVCFDVSFLGNVFGGPPNAAKCTGLAVINRQSADKEIMKVVGTVRRFKFYVSESLPSQALNRPNSEKVFPST